MGRFDRISDEERQKIPEIFRCEVSYNGFHMWQVVGELGCEVLCLKCLEKRLLSSLKEK